jgi:aspartate/methionine/tyrosine aminotransferase
MNPLVTALEGSTIRALHARRRPTSIDLGLGQPTLPPTVEYFERATRWVAEHGCPYSTNAGDVALREAIASHYAYPALDVAANVCVTTGSQEAVYVALKTVLDPQRDELLVVEPAFPIYGKIAQLEGIAVRKVSMGAAGGFAFDPERILEAIGPATRVVVVCSPCNPTGKVIGDAAVRRIAQALLDRPGPPVYVLHDEIYREQTYVEDAGEFAKHYPYTLAINSLSKSNSLTGLRLGWVISPADVSAEIVKAHGWVTSCASTFGQRVALEIFQDCALGEHAAWYRTQRDAVIPLARASGLDFIEPEGAFYLCLRAGVADSKAFCFELLEREDVVAVPGRLFDASFEGWVRTSFVGPLADIREGFARIAEMSALAAAAT